MNKQSEIMKYLLTVETASLKDICDNVPFGYYHNGHKYVGEILTRMVKQKRIIRVSKGIYRVNNLVMEAKQNNLF